MLFELESYAFRVEKTCFSQWKDVLSKSDRKTKAAEGSAASVFYWINIVIEYYFLTTFLTIVVPSFAVAFSM